MISRKIQHIIPIIVALCLTNHSLLDSGDSDGSFYIPYTYLARFSSSSRDSLISEQFHFGSIASYSPTGDDLVINSQFQAQITAFYGLSTPLNWTVRMSQALLFAMRDLEIGTANDSEAEFVQYHSGLVRIAFLLSESQQQGSPTPSVQGAPTLIVGLDHMALDNSVVPSEDELIRDNSIANQLARSFAPQNQLRVVACEAYNESTNRVLLSHQIDLFWLYFDKSGGDEKITFDGSLQKIFEIESNAGSSASLNFSDFCDESNMSIRQFQLFTLVGRRIDDNKICDTGLARDPIYDALDSTNTTIILSNVDLDFGGSQCFETSQMRQYWPEHRFRKMIYKPEVLNEKDGDVQIENAELKNFNSIKVMLCTLLVGMTVVLFALAYLQFIML